MSRAFLLAVTATVALSANVFDREVYEKAFFDHVLKFNLNFKDGAEFAKRLQVFADNYDMIDAHNKGNFTYTLGFNQFSHLTHAEFLDAVHLGGTRPPFVRREPTGKIHTAPADVSAIPTEVDWTKSGAVAEIKDQGSCGSCWAFSTVGTLESAHYLKYGALKVFSEQELVSCDNVDLGCNGGWMDDAFTWVKGNGGLTLGESYAYTSGKTGQTGSCVKTGYTNVPESAPASYTDVQVRSVTALASAVAQQPVAIAIQANQIAFQSYSGGVLTGKCGTRLDHGVIAVGYGTLNGVDYWKVRNSWGPKWGMDGYVLIEKSSANLCGVLEAPSYPNL